MEEPKKSKFRQIAQKTIDERRILCLEPLPASTAASAQPPAEMAQYRAFLREWTTWQTEITKEDAAQM